MGKIIDGEEYESFAEGLYKMSQKGIFGAALT